MPVYEGNECHIDVTVPKIRVVVGNALRIVWYEWISEQIIMLKAYFIYYHTHNRFMALFPGPLGWDGARRELLDFMVQWKINRGRHIDHPAGRHSIRTNQCPPPPSPHIFTGRMPFLPPNQLHQSTEGTLFIINQSFSMKTWFVSYGSVCVIHVLS